MRFFLHLLASLALASSALAAEKPMLAAPALPPVSPVPADSRQMLLSVSRDWSATTTRVRAFERAAGGPWKPVDAPFAGSLGRTGMAWGRGLHPEDVVGTRKKE